MVSLNNQLINKPKTREEALTILKKLNNSKHYLISSVCISRKGSMIWNYTDKASLTMKKMEDSELKEYLSKIKISEGLQIFLSKRIFANDKPKIPDPIITNFIILNFNNQKVIL